MWRARNENKTKPTLPSQPPKKKKNTKKEKKRKGPTHPAHDRLNDAAYSCNCCTNPTFGSAALRLDLTN